MLELSKKVLEKVSFDKVLFQKELKKAISWINKEELTNLKTFCFATFAIHHDVVREVFETI